MDGRKEVDKIHERNQDVGDRISERLITNCRVLGLMLCQRSGVPHVYYRISFYVGKRAG